MTFPQRPRGHVIASLRRKRTSTAPSGFIPRPINDCREAALNSRIHLVEWAVASDDILWQSLKQARFPALTGELKLLA